MCVILLLYVGLPDSSPEIDLSSRDGRQMCSDSAWDASNCLGANSTGFELDSVPSRIGGLAEGSWVVPMLALAAVNVVVILAFEAFIVCKAYRNTPSRRHLFLGQMLLLGLLIGK